MSGNGWAGRFQLRHIPAAAYPGRRVSQPGVTARLGDALKLQGRSVRIRCRGKRTGSNGESQRAVVVLG